MNFEEATVEIVFFSAEDVITTSTMMLTKGDVETEAFNFSDWETLWK